jgi:HTH-type transcriptional regulator/antitoxin HigA
MEALMKRTEIEQLTSHFQALSAVVPLHAINSEREYDAAVHSLNSLLDAGAANENHPLADLVDTLGALIESFDRTHYPIETASPVATLRELMTQNGLTQSDLPELGTQGVVSEILNFKRDMNVRQIRALAERFHVPVNAFI